MSKIQKLLKSKRLAPFRKLFKRSFRFFEPGKLWGVPVRLHTSAFLFFAFISLLRSPIVAISLVIGLILHEYAHIFMGKSLKISTSHVNFSAAGGAAVFGRGTFEKIFNNGKLEAKIAAVGPLASCVLTSIGFIGATASKLLGFEALASIFYEFGYINLLLAGFNALPIFPLDGGRMLRGYLHAYHFKNINDKKKLNEVLIRLARSIGIVSYGVLWTVPGILIWSTIRASLKEFESVQAYIEHHSRLYDYVPDGKHTPIFDDWWGALGLLHPPQTFADAKRAYRKRVAKVHPDKGGSEEQMLRAIHALAIAKHVFKI